MRCARPRRTIRAFDSSGYVTGEAKQALLKQADYLLVPSLWYENAPVAVIEAAAHGVAVIASRIGGLPEFVREGRTGLLFEPGDAAGLAAIMHGLLHGTLATGRSGPGVPEPRGAAHGRSHGRIISRPLSGFAHVTHPDRSRRCAPHGDGTCGVALCCWCCCSRLPRQPGARSRSSR